MVQVCCDRQKFQRHPDPNVADIGHGGGAEYTIGSCAHCGQPLIHCWVAGGISECVLVVTQALIDSFLAATDPRARKKLLSDWFND